jgi:DNA primase
MSNIDEIKQRTDIVDLISDYISLQKAGRNFKALCPFHVEKHPSFFVFPEQQTWHCFGACGTGGDVFSFIMKKEGISFSEALQLLASRAGITLNQDKTTADKVEDKKRLRLFQLNEAASEYYHHLLLNTSAGERAKNYLNKRNVSMKTAEEFHLGFSPDSWEALMKFLTSKGYEEQEMKDAGLIIERETGGSYDRFRNHLMFPIHNIQGQVTGFGARTMDESLPKYINSPQTLVFDKGNSIYGIDKANPFIKKEGLVIIMEGYMDVLTAHQHGWQNSVAAMGTSLTENQVAIVRKLSKNIALALDADAAGEQATLRSTEVVARFIDKAEVTVIAMPPGKDPDDVISGDPELWRKLMKEGLPIFDFALETVTKQVDKGNAKEKSIAVQKLLPLIHEIKDPIQQSHYERKLARKLDIEETSISTALDKWRNGKTRRYEPVTRKKNASSHPNTRNPVEEYCLALLLRYPELSNTAQELSVEHFENPVNRELFAQWRRYGDYTEMKKQIATSLLEHLDYLLGKPILEQTASKQQHALSDCVLRLQERKLKKREAEKAIMLEVTREQEGTAAELAKLEEQGTSSSEQIMAVQLKRREITRG